MRNAARVSSFAIATLLSCSLAHAADQALIDAAKKEGTVTWYTTQIVNQLARPAAEAFKKKYGINVDFVRADSAAVALRVTTEAQAGRVEMGVDLCGRDRGVTQQLLDGPEIRPALQQMGREGVTERVGRDSAGRRRLPHPDRQAPGQVGG